MGNGRKSTTKQSTSTGEQDHAKWWFVKVNDEVFVEKKKGRIKLGKVALGAVKHVLPSNTKPNILKVLCFVPHILPSVCCLAMNNVHHI